VLLINLLFATPAAYAFARLRWRFKGGFYNFILGAADACHGGCHSYYVIIQSLKLMNTRLSLMLVYSALTIRSRSGS